VRGDDGCDCARMMMIVFACAVMRDAKDVVNGVSDLLQSARSRAGNNNAGAEKALAEVTFDELLLCCLLRLRTLSQASSNVGDTVKQLMKTLGTGGNAACDEAIARIVKVRARD
jgi:hypothetical protein